MIIHLRRQGLISFAGDDRAPPGRPLTPMFDWLVKNPKYFCLADDNFALREIAAYSSGGKHDGVALLTRTRRKVEDNLAKGLGHDDLSIPAPKVPSPAEGGHKVGHARNFLLRALIREKTIKGRLDAPAPSRR
jgi:hypothetical protein